VSSFAGRFQRDIKTVFWFALGIFIALALVSFYPQDPSFNSRGNFGTIHNWAGIIGSYLADSMYQLFGISAWLLVIGLFWLAKNNLKTEIKFFSPARFLWGLLITLSLSSLISVYFREKSLFSYHIPLGGTVGAASAKGLEKIFNTGGCSVILWTLLLLMVMFYTEKPLTKLIPRPRFQWRWYVFSFFRKAKATMRTVVAYFVEEIKKGLAGSGVKEVTVPSMDMNSDMVAEPQFKINPYEERASAAPIIPRQQLKLALTPQKKKVEIKAKVVRKVEHWMLPDINQLEDPPESRVKISERELREKGATLLEKLKQFSIFGTIVDIRPGPAVTMFEFKPNADVKISRIIDLADDISLALSSESVRIIAPIPGRDVVGIETSNSLREQVFFKEIVADDEFWDPKMLLPIVLGRAANGDTSIVELRKMPHLLVAGTTGSGKSVFLVSALTGLLVKHSPKTLRLILIDPKQVDLATFSQIPHLLMPPIVTPKKAVTALKWAIKEMEKRYRTMSKFGARGLEGFNQIVSNFSAEEIKGHEEQNQKLKADPSTALEDYYFQPLPYIVIIVEEFGDLMAVDKNNVEHTVIRLAQMARACGIHLILAMQSPRRDVITGLIKTNIPGRISFKVASKMDSRIILDESGAERLLAQGDMLFLAPGVAKPERNHGAWIQEKEVESVTRFWMKQGEPDFDPLAMRVLEGSGSEFGDPQLDGHGEIDTEMMDGMADEKYDEILAYVSTMKEVSASLLQRKFRLGYPRAARLIEIFEEQGVVGPANGSKPRQVLIDSYNNR
jgi:DNA segregation ATPase FtsK/SpoIIIE, S-DNA-T family